MVKNQPANEGYVGLIPRSGRSPGGENDYQYSCLYNPMGEGAWRATAHAMAEDSETTSQLNNNYKYSIVLIYNGLSVY